MGSWTNFAAAQAAVTNRFVTSVNMKATPAYTLANAGAMPSAGARHVTCTRTVVGDIDTPGGTTITVTGKNLSGQTITEVLTVGGHTVLVTGTKWFASVTAVTPVGGGWVVDVGTTTPDTIVVGCGAACIVAEGSGVLEGITVNTSAAGTIVISDVNGTIATLPANQTVGNYEYDVTYSGYLSVILGAASDVTVIHGPSLPQSYSK
jgi:hypothetical protein